MQKRICVPISRLLLLSVAVILVGASLRAQDSVSNLYTSGLLNGRFWENLDAHAKQDFFLGLIEGLRTGVMELTPTNGNSSKAQEAVKKALDTYERKFNAKGFTYEDHVKELDKLYADRENILIPIPVALQYCVLKLGGGNTNADLEQLLIGMRKLASAPEEKKP